MATARSGDLMTRATKDVDRIEVFFAHTFAPMVSAVVVPATVLALIGARVSWAVAGAALPFLLAALLVAPAAGRRAALASSRAAAPARAQGHHHDQDDGQGAQEAQRRHQPLRPRPGRQGHRQAGGAAAQLQHALAQAQAGALAPPPGPRPEPAPSGTLPPPGVRPAGVGDGDP